MNIYEKINKVRLELAQMKLKKSGQNKFAGFDYYQLEDLLPAIVELEDKYKLFSEFDLGSEAAVLTITNAEDPKERVDFTSPVDTLTLKGTNAIQNIGGTHTYLRRYLYINAYNIVEPDLFDATSGATEKPKKTSYKEVSKEELNEAKANGYVETITSDDYGHIMEEINQIGLDKGKTLKDWICTRYKIKSLPELPRENYIEAMGIIQAQVKKVLSTKETI